MNKPSLVFATHNTNKLAEVAKMLPNYKLLSLTDIGCTEEIPETATTLEGNAKLKADYVTQKFGYDCFADDTGLIVPALNGEPGVYSARYAGEPTNAEANIALLLKNLCTITDRKAHFKTVICLNIQQKQLLFEGVCDGEITVEKKGTNGFGYDPIFVPEGYSHTFAELDLDIKNRISHRGFAIEKLITFLNTNKL